MTLLSRVITLSHYHGFRILSSGQHLPLSRSLKTVCRNFFARFLDDRIINKHCSLLLVKSIKTTETLQFRIQYSVSSWTSKHTVLISAIKFDDIPISSFTRLQWCNPSSRFNNFLLSRCSCTTVHPQEGELKRAGARGTVVASVRAKRNSGGARRVVKYACLPELHE